SSRSGQPPDVRFPPHCGRSSRTIFLQAMASAIDLPMPPLRLLIRPLPALRMATGRKPRWKITLGLPRSRRNSVLLGLTVIPHFPAFRANLAVHTAAWRLHPAQPSATAPRDD